jgi:serine/threonine-protein kinase
MEGGMTPWSEAAQVPEPAIGPSPACWTGARASRQSAVAKRTSELQEMRRGDVLGGKYLLVEHLAKGGMGELWIARNLATGAEVAAKVLLSEHATSPEGLARFRREARTTATLSHRAILRVFDLVQIAPPRGALLLVMELLRGRSLAEHLQSFGPLSIEATLELAFPLLSALTHVHGAGIVHRDLKPENVFLSLEPDGQWMPKILDFGISKELRDCPITLDGEIVGTITYMSPEQTVGAPVDGRSDLFSFAILLYECLSGQNPFVDPATGFLRGKNLLSLFDSGPPPLPNVPPAIFAVIQKALARNPDERYANAGEMARALREAARASELEHALPPPSIPSMPSMPAARRPVSTQARTKAPRRRRVGRMAALFAALVLIGTLASGITAASSRLDHVPAVPAAVILHAKEMVPTEDVLELQPIETPSAAEAPIAAKTFAPAPKRPRRLRLLLDPGF